MIQQLSPIIDPISVMAIGRLERAAWALHRNHHLKPALAIRCGITLPDYLKNKKINKNLQLHQSCQNHHHVCKWLSFSKDCVCYGLLEAVNTKLKLHHPVYHAANYSLGYHLPAHELFVSTIFLCREMVEEKYGVFKQLEGCWVQFILRENCSCNKTWALVTIFLIWLMWIYKVVIQLQTPASHTHWKLVKCHSQLNMFWYNVGLFNNLHWSRNACFLVYQLCFISCIHGWTQKFNGPLFSGWSRNQFNLWKNYMGGGDKGWKMCRFHVIGLANLIKHHILSMA